MAPGALPYDDTVHFIGTDRSARTGSYATRPAGEEVMLAYFGGKLAIELEQRNELESLRARRADADIRQHAFRMASVAASARHGVSDPWARGSYSAALPGKAHGREQLNETLNEQIFFAGEACSLDYFGTIHGAWHSGVSAAKQALVESDRLEQQPRHRPARLRDDGIRIADQFEGQYQAAAREIVFPGAMIAHDAPARFAVPARRRRPAADGPQARGAVPDPA